MNNKKDDEFAVTVRTDKPTEDKTDEQVFDEVVEANDEPTPAPEAVSTQATPEPVAVEREVTAHPTVAVTAPASHVVADDPKPARSNSPGMLVLQWVTYAFWGWFALAMLWLIVLTFSYFIAGNDSQSWGDALAYPLASVIVMLIFAVVADLFYAKHEPEQKSGGSSVIMLIHAVLFVLLTVGSLVVAVFSLINMSINSGPTSGADGPTVALLSSLSMLLLYSLASARVLFGGRKTILRTVLLGVSTAMAIGFTLACIIGPATRANVTKDDRLIESGLSYLAQDIQSYTRENDKLPATLSDVKSTSNYTKDKVQALISKKLVEYKPNSKPATTDGGGVYYSDDRTTTGTSTKLPSGQTFYFQLCVDYKAEKNPDYYYYKTNSIDGSEGDYSSYIDVSSHKKGNVCYDVSATGKYPDYGGVKPL
ncbi:hypothetical protein IPM09_00170 [Candidatus Saccharibacteria bacterium]|nr:MAG: hypothetical protein IPM09_00170 [Candidatus Saccharibacteria bacterium]